MSNYIASTHNIHTPRTSTCTTHPAIPSQLLSTTLLCTQLTNTKHSWQNGTRCRDGVNVLWCRSHLVWLVFEGSIPTCVCFHSENFFVTFYACTGLTKFTRFETLYVILLNIHKTLPKWLLSDVTGNGFKPGELRLYQMVKM